MYTGIIAAEQRIYILTVWKIENRFCRMNEHQAQKERLFALPEGSCVGGEGAKAKRQISPILLLKLE
ncbi:MAG TPA: hypothetical protein DEP42_06490 [Ruminococcaceae bacterium]|nr:hypothetical protein [Oscillospiraceae bacterium]